MKKTSTTKTAKQNGAVNGNLVEKLTLEILSDRHNALARYIGIPCEVNASAMLNGAATSAGCLKKKKSYAGYRVDLQHFKGEFSKIRFRAASNGEDVVFGYIVDCDGNIESLSQSDHPTIATVTLPLTPQSRTLYATVPAFKGKPEWENVTVELLHDGILTKVEKALNTLHSQICTLEKRVAEVMCGNTCGENSACLC